MPTLFVSFIDFVHLEQLSFYSGQARKINSYKHRPKNKFHSNSIVLPLGASHGYFSLLLSHPESKLNSTRINYFYSQLVQKIALPVCPQYSLQVKLQLTKDTKLYDF